MTSFLHTCLILGLIPVMLIACTGGVSDEGMEKTLVIDNVTLIDAISGSRADMRVVIQEGVIKKVEPVGGMLSAGVTRVDANGKYLIPGLWDAHVHFTYDKEVAKSMLTLFLWNGITNVRDTGGLLKASLSWKQKAAARPTSSPRVFIAGPLLDGHPAVYDGSDTTHPKLAVSLTTVEKAEAMVDSLADAGVDFVKVYEMLKPDVYHAILKRATLHNLPVAGHIPLSITAGEASDAGLDSVEHLRNLELACTRIETEMVEERKSMLADAENVSGAELREQAHAQHRFHAINNMDWPSCERIIAQHQHNGTRHVPTVALVKAVYDGFHTSPEWRASFNFLPDDLQKQWTERSDAMANMFAGDPEGDASRAAYLAWINRVISTMVGDSMLMAGTDTPIFFMTPGFSLHRELEELVRAGISPLQALEAATLTPARFFNLQGEMGSITPGKVADLVLLSADPLQDIRNTQKIDAVVRAGKFYDRTALDDLLKDALNKSIQDFSEPAK